MAVVALKTPEDEQTKRVLKMIQAAEIDRNRHINRLHDCYKYAMPWRHRANQNQPTDQLDEIFDSELASVIEDFSADMGNTFTPQKSAWVEAKPVETLDSGDVNQIKQALDKYSKVIFSEMARSNLYQALQEAYLDLGPGTMALIVTDIDPAQPLHCEAIPCTDLLLNRGAYGRLDGMFRKKRRPGEEIKVLWANATAPDAGFKDDTDYEVIDGVYRDHSNRADEAWHYCVLVDGKKVWTQSFVGQGSNPFIVARWSRDSTTAWGMGPTYRTLPEVKTLNHFRYTSLKNYDSIADPIVSYEDDGVMNVDHGLNPGDWIPRSPGSKMPEPIESGRDIQYEVFQIDEVRHSIRRAHYQDRPEQEGKTPPTATQWADEAAERARRMGTPATNLVVELQYPLFRRFAYLLTLRGKLPPVKLNGETVALEPVSPLLRAQQQEEVVRIERYTQIVGTMAGPEAVQVILKLNEIAKDLAEHMGVKTKYVRTEEEIAAVVQQMAQAAQAQQGAEGAA
jgi:hypothetical protein